MEDKNNNNKKNTAIAMMLEWKKIILLTPNQAKDP